MKKTIILGALFAAGILLLGGSLLLINSKLNRLGATIAERDTALRAQLDADAQILDRLKQGVLLLNQDTNLFRDYLQLPPQSLPLFDEEEEAENSRNTNELYFSAVRTLLDQREREEAMIAFGNFLASESVTALLEERDLLLRNHHGLTAELWKGADKLYYRLQAGSPENSFRAVSIRGEEATIDSPAVFSGYLGENDSEIDRFYTRLSLLEREMENLEREGELMHLLDERGLTLSASIDSGTRTLRNIENLGGEILLTIGLEKAEAVWTLQGRNYQDKHSLLTAAANAVDNLDLRSREERLTQEGCEEIESLRSDAGFLAYLKTESLVMASEPREDLYYFYYDLIDENGDSAGSFAVQKNFGELYLMDKDDVPVTSLKTLGIQQGFEIKKKGILPSEIAPVAPMDLGKGDKTFLLIGANEANTDTIMVVHLSGTTGRGTIVSVPRDLYYKGRKINSIYPLFGPEQLKKTLSEITGLPIQRYLYIDMFAFADVVDLIGGIDITLEEPLIDPTYVTKENGKWSTLHYEAGTHHLGGVETLRVARSRHTSDDFGRAARQQMILMAVKDQISEMNAGAVTKAVDLIEVLMNYVRTDFSVLELFNLFLNHKDDSFNNHVLSWDNVLYHSFSNLYLLGDDVEVDENFNKGAWIMLPMNNDWNVIRWFIRNIITKGKDA